jgi:rhodanese-related sulfurtransferase
MSRTLDELLDDARARIKRLTPSEALAATEIGGLIIDIRSDLDRERLGVVPGSVHIPRTVLEWRVAPTSPWRNPHLGEHDRKLIILCDHGYSSTLAAATLVELGLDAADVIGGFEAWQETRLPITAPARRLDPGELAGMGPPEASV